MSTPREPSWAERARTALAQARVGTLQTGRCPRSQELTMVGVEEHGDGVPLVWLREDSPAVRMLSSCRMARLTLAGAGDSWQLQVVGTFHPRRRTSGSMCGFRPNLLSIRVAAASSFAVPLASFLAAEPDPLRDDAAAVLRHLDQAHGRELLACARAHGRHADAVVPRALDRYGLELSLLSEQGVDRLRLEFPSGPVQRLGETGAAGFAPLACACRR